MDAVMRLLKGEDLDSLSRELKVNAATLSSCRSTVANDPLEGLKVSLVARSDAATLPKRAAGGDAPPRREPIEATASPAQNHPTGGMAQPRVGLGTRDVAAAIPAKSDARGTPTRRLTPRGP
jgi:hypothetical protein